MAGIWNIALDLGGRGVRMATRRKGVIYAESALAAFRTGQKDYVALGAEARTLRGREIAGMRTGVMLQGGRVAREALLDMWLGYLLDAAARDGAARATVLMVGGPNAREADLQALRSAVMRAGAPGMSVLEAEFAAALGAWYPQDVGTELGAQVDVMDNVGTMVVDVGAYSMFAALIAGGRIVRRETLPYGLDSAEQDLRRALRGEYALAAGENTVEEAMWTLGAMDLDRHVPPLEIIGLHLEKLLPVRVQLRSATVADVLRPYAEAAARLAASVLLHAPEELAADIRARGLLLTGGGARYPMIAKAVERETGVRCRPSDEPEKAAIRGAMRVMSAPARFGDLPLNAEEG